MHISTTSLADRGGLNLSDASDSSANEKLTMQNLNEHLASYLEKANADLELKICQFLDIKSSPQACDNSAYFATISDLQTKVESLLTHYKVPYYSRTLACSLVHYILSQPLKPQ